MGYTGETLRKFQKRGRSGHQEALSFTSPSLGPGYSNEVPPELQGRDTGPMGLPCVAGRTLLSETWDSVLSVSFTPRCSCLGHSAPSSYKRLTLLNSGGFAFLGRRSWARFRHAFCVLPAHQAQPFGVRLASTSCPRPRSHQQPGAHLCPLYRGNLCWVDSSVADKSPGTAKTAPSRRR